MIVNQNSKHPKRPKMSVVSREERLCEEREGVRVKLQLWRERVGSSRRGNFWRVISDLEMSTQIAAPLLALMARTLGTGSLATGSFGNRLLAKDNLMGTGLAWGHSFTENCLESSMLPLFLMDNSVLALKALALGNGHLAQGHLVAGTWQLAAGQSGT